VRNLVYFAVKYESPLAKINKQTFPRRAGDTLFRREMDVVRVGVDVGGSHVTVAVLDPQDVLAGEKVTRREVSAGESPLRALGDALCAALETRLRPHRSATVEVGVGMPGPFSHSCGKQEHKWSGMLLFTDVRASVRSRLLCFAREELEGVVLDINVVLLFNDADAFGAGVARSWKTLFHSDVEFKDTPRPPNILAITLGTGLGASFVTAEQGGEVGWSVTSEPTLWDKALGTQGEAKIAENFFSGTAFDAIAVKHGLLGGAKKLLDTAIADAELENLGEQFARFLFEYARNMGDGGSCIVIGGGATPLFRSKMLGGFRRTLSSLSRANGGSAIDAVCIPQMVATDELAAVGAAVLLMHSDTDPVPVDARFSVAGVPIRETVNALSPLRHPAPRPEGEYQLFPAHSVFRAGTVKVGELEQLVSGNDVICVDGYPGVLFGVLCDQIMRAVAPRCCRFVGVEGALRPDLEAYVAPFLGGDDPLWGTRFTGSLVEFFREQDVVKLRKALVPQGDELVVVYGVGASAVVTDGTAIVFVDLPKNEQQYRARVGSARNLGVTSPLPPKTAYKRSYFVDWVAMGRQYRDLLHNRDLLAVVDGQRIESCVWVGGSELKRGLRDLAAQPLRARPWFEPGVWGGQYLKELVPELDQSAPNYAWSFELIAPENGVVLSDSVNTLEVAFETLLYCCCGELLGDHGEAVFGPEFPIRFDYLDTVQGGNLSLQCHPSNQYIREHFGETITQDESYYIFDQGNDGESHVYLGFTDDCDPETFESTLRESASSGREVDVTKFVNRWESKKGDLFLIPHCTIHASGAGNVVLEISATPYIFTNKLYDWNRLGMDGLPRPLNVERGMQNLDFARTTDYTERKLLAHNNTSSVVSGQGAASIVHLPTTEHVFYDVERIEFGDTGEVVRETNDVVHVLNLVAGASASLVIGTHAVRMNRGETWIVPAAARAFTVQATAPAQILDVFVKDGCELRKGHIS
jgi:mannose-6-phosphate isomerase class I/predicted NBD/HSP70 family sugar kinase